MINNYRNAIRIILLGRYDKNNYTSSIYQGYDRYQQTISGGGVTLVSILQMYMIMVQLENLYLVQQIMFIYQMKQILN
jgi:hypothetical protein